MALSAIRNAAAVRLSSGRTVRDSIHARSSFFRKHRTASEFLVRDCVFVDEVVKGGPGGGYALFGQEPGGTIDSYSVCFDRLVLAPEVGEFGKNRVYCIADDGLQLRGGGDDNRFIHTLTLLSV